MSVKYVERKGTGSRKWDGMWNKFGSDDLIAMWIADMDFELAEPIKNALKDHIDKYPLGYSIPPESYYENFIEWEKKYHGYEVKRDWICFGCGIVASFNMVVLMLTKPGEAVMTVTPCYYPMQDAATTNDRKLVMCDMDRDGMTYTLDLAKFEKCIVDNDVKLFLMSSPHNPVGKIWTADELRGMMDICKKHGVYVVSDEIHADFEWQDYKHIPTATLGDYDSFLITMCAASKSFNLAGLQNSYIIIPDDELRARYKDFQTRLHTTGGNILGYVASAAAFGEGREWFDEVRKVIYDNYLYVKETFEKRAPKVKVAELQGTYLLWIDLGAYFKTQDQVRDFCENKCGIAFDYGAWFGGEKYAPFVRMNLATSRSYVEAACKAMLENLPL